MNTFIIQLKKKINFFNNTLSMRECYMVDIVFLQKRKSKFTTNISIAYHL